jgi:hypothetical protein
MRIRIVTEGRPTTQKKERRAARIIHPPMDPHGARGRPLKGREKRRLLKIYKIGRN